MASSCAMCGKGKQYGHLVSHAKNRVNRSWKPNLQVMTIVADGVKQRLTLCTRCLRLVRAAMADQHKQAKIEAVAHQQLRSLGGQVAAV